MGFKKNVVKADLRSYPPYLIMGQSKIGKALANGSKVYTPNGPVEIQDLEVGDEIFNSYGGVSHVVGVFPQGKKNCMEVTFSDKTSCIASEDHLWAVRTGKMKKLGKGFTRILTTKEIYESYVRDQVNNNGDVTKIYRYEIPVASCVNYPEKKISIDPYLMGYLIGNGYLCGNVVSFSTNDDIIVEKISDIVKKYGMNVSKAKGKNYSYIIHKPENSYTNPIRQKLIEYGLNVHSCDKFIPSDYLYNTKEIRLEILRGLMDSDGFINTSGHAKFTTGSIKLAEDVQLLVESLGGIATINEYNREDKANIEYVMNIAIQGETIVSLPRKLERYGFGAKEWIRRKFIDIKSVGEFECTCIKTDADDELFLTENYIVTHNTTLFRDLVLYNFKNEENGLLISFSDEEGYKALDKLQYEQTSFWDMEEDEEGNRGFTQIVDDLIENKANYGIEMVCLDTLDKMVEVVSKQVFEEHRKLKGKYPLSLNDALGGLTSN